MEDPSIAFSPTAAAWVAESVQKARTGWLREREAAPERPALVPVIAPVRGSWRHSGGVLIECIEESHCRLVWYERERCAADAFVAVEVLDVEVFVSRDALNELSGRRLMLENVDVGFPKPSALRKDVLRAVPAGPSDDRAADE